MASGNRSEEGDPPGRSDGDQPSVALLLSGPDRDLVADELSDDYDVLPPTDGVPAAFDVAVVGGRELAAHGDALAARAAAAGTFLPVLCLLPPGADPDPTVWERADDVATRPLSRRELRSRIASLLDTRRLSVALRRRGERLERVGSAIAHDIRNPLGIASGHVDLAAETGDVERLGPAAEALDRIDRLIDDVLSMAREGPEAIDPEPTDLAATARAAWGSVETGDAALSLPDDPLSVEADESRLRELFENLFRNAVEHGSTGSRPPTDDSVEHGSTDDRPAPGEPEARGSGAGPDAPADRRDDAGLRVEVGPLPDGAGFYVADDGVGIPAAERETVFDRGYTTSEDGTGFGLNIVRVICDGHGWTVRVAESEAGGARFEIAVLGAG